MGAIAATATAAVLSFVQIESNDGIAQAFASSNSVPTDGMSLSIFVGDGVANGASMTNPAGESGASINPNANENSAVSAQGAQNHSNAVASASSGATGDKFRVELGVEFVAPNLLKRVPFLGNFPVLRLQLQQCFCVCE